MSSPWYGHLLVHFVEDATGHGERIYLSRSAGADARHWERLNGGRPILQSDLGTTGVRDPFLVRTDDGFVLLATDLRVFGGDDAGWDAWRRHGSRSLVIWSSDDLVVWTAPQLVEVAPPTVGMVWAPEVLREESTGDYLVYWSSTLYDEADEAHEEDSWSRILVSRTTDFRTFSPPHVLVDRGVPLIDMAAVASEGRVHRFLKEDAYGEDSLRLHQEMGSSFFAEDFTSVTTRIGEDRHTRVEGPIIFRDLNEPIWYLLVDQFDTPPQGYIAYWTDDLASGHWHPLAADEFHLPPATKHGSVIPITLDEWERVGRIDVDLDG